MFAATGAFAKVGKVMVSVAMAIGDPSGVTATGAGLEAYLQLHETLSGRHPELAQLSKEIERDLDKALKNPCFHCPKDADKLLPQMIESALPTPEDYTDTNLDAEKILALLESKLTDPAHKNAAILTAFRGLYLPVLQKITNDPRLTDALNPALWRKNMNQNDAILAALQNLQTAPRAVLIALAEKFEIPTPKDLRDEALIEKLSLKAEEYHALKSEIDAIDDTMRGLANVKAAAKDAIDRLDFEEVENLLAMVHTAELEVAAKTARLRAHNALMRGRGQQAYNLLAICADSFGSEDPTAPLHKRVEFALILYDHGLRYGGDGLQLAIRMNRDILAKTTLPADNDLWARTQNNLANALADQGRRTGGSAGNALLAQAITAYRAALTVYTEAAHPVDWADTQNNLAIALKTQGSRTGGSAGNELLAQAVAAYRAALTVRTEAAHPVEWAATQNNLAAALADQGRCTDGSAGNALLARAVTAYRAALTVYTEVAHPVQWATTQNNLATALQTQGSRTGGSAGNALLAQAVAACRAALTVRTEAAHPVGWAETQGNLAEAFLAMAGRADCADPDTPLAQALQHVEAALTVYDPQNMPFYHEEASELRDKILAARAA